MRRALNLTFGDCGGATTATWTCTTNSGAAFTAVCSVVCPAGLTTLVAEEGVVEIAFPTAVPDWWKLGTGFCRAGMPSPSATRSARSPASTTSVASARSWAATRTRSVRTPASATRTAPIDANRVRIRTISAVDFAAAQLATPPAGGDEIFLFSISVNKTKTVGTGACAGCDSPAWMALKQVKLNQPAGVGDPVVGSRDVFGCGSMQGAPEAECAHATPTSRSSWGQLKSLYR